MVAGPNSPEEPLAVLILGPTGSGKTALSLAIGQAFDGEIVSCDSVAVYRGMDIGSAKPTPAELASLPHHLIDIANPDQPMTAGEYSRQAREAMRQIAARGRMPIVTGGTGLYLRALTMGLFPGPARQDDLRARLNRSQERLGGGWLYRILSRLDPVSASRIHANDLPKLIRAIEVSITTGKPMSVAIRSAESDSDHPGRDPLTGFRLLRIGLNPPRQALYDHLNRRAAAMFLNGVIEETRALVEQFGRVQALDALGYRQALAILDGALTLDEAVTAAQQGHRNYAKRQLTWFRREPDVHWIEDFGNSPESVQTAVQLIESHLPTPPSPTP